MEDAYASGSYAWADVEKRASNGKQLEIGQIVGLVVGAVAAGGGATLLWLGYRGASDEPVSSPPQARASQG